MRSRFFEAPSKYGSSSRLLSSSVGSTDSKIGQSMPSKGKVVFGPLDPEVWEKIRKSELEGPVLKAEPWSDNKAVEEISVQDTLLALKKMDEQHRWFIKEYGNDRPEEPPSLCTLF